MISGLSPVAFARAAGTHATFYERSEGTLDCPPANDQVVYQHDQSNDQQDVNEAATDVTDESQ